MYNKLYWSIEIINKKTKWITLTSDMFRVFFLPQKRVLLIRSKIAIRTSLICDHGHKKIHHACVIKLIRKIVLIFGLNGYIRMVEKHMALKFMIFINTFLFDSYSNNAKF